MRTFDRTNPAKLADALRVSLSGRAPTVEAAEGASPAGVLVPLQLRGDSWHVILNRRSDHVSQHAGEIAFPGGRLEPSDSDMQECALRESWEEMGIRPADVDVLGPLNSCLTRTNFLVWPIVGVVPHPYDFTPDAREVAEVIEVPLEHLLDGAAVRHEARLLPGGVVVRRTAYAHDHHLVFGATAWILADLLSIIDGIE